MTGILDTIRKLIGAGDSASPFDIDLLMNINAVLTTLRQLGVGPSTGFITTETSEWSDFLGDSIKLELVKMYVYLRVKLIFDPPLSSAAVDAMKRQADEYEWRILVEVDPPLVIAQPVEDGDPIV